MQLPDARYFYRELLPRAVLLTITFKWLLPLLGFFAFPGGLLAATVFGVAFTAWFCLWGAYIMGSDSVQKWLLNNKGRSWMFLVHASILILVPAFALAFAAWIAPATFSMDWLYGLPAGVVALNLVCMATHDYRSR